MTSLEIMIIPNLFLIGLQIWMYLNVRKRNLEGNTATFLGWCLVISGACYLLSIAIVISNHI